MYQKITILTSPCDCPVEFLGQELNLFFHLVKQQKCIDSLPHLRFSIPKRLSIIEVTIIPQGIIQINFQKLRKCEVLIFWKQKLARIRLLQISPSPIIKDFNCLDYWALLQLDGLQDLFLQNFWK